MSDFWAKLVTILGALQPLGFFILFIAIYYRLQTFFDDITKIVNSMRSIAYELEQLNKKNKYD